MQTEPRLIAPSPPNDAAVDSSDTVVFFGELASTAQAQDDSTLRRRALGQAAWLETFWLPTQQRKHPNHVLCIDATQCSVRVKSSSSSRCNMENDDAAEHNKKSAPVSSAEDTCHEYWDKALQTALKKIRVEDLGDLAAQEVWDAIPVQDKDGRGRQDLDQLQKQLSVKVVFLVEDNHILLVGAKAKLEKKCLVLRNVLSHYYWRLKGKQIHL